jgi:hypothetical protein
LLETPRGHQVHEQREVAELDDGHLADPPYPGDLFPRERRQRRVVRLHGHHAGRQRRLDPGTRQRLAQTARGDLDLR